MTPIEVVNDPHDTDQDDLFDMRQITDPAVQAAVNNFSQNFPALNQLIEQNGYTTIDVSGTVKQGLTDAGQTDIAQTAPPTADGFTNYVAPSPGTPSIYIGASTGPNGGTFAAADIIV
jgi:hypothetical protein